MLGVVVSRADEVSVAIGDRLRDLAAWETATDDALADADGGGTVRRTDGAELRTFEDLHLDLERPAAAFDDPDLLVFVSRHAGDTGPLLTAHHTGNVGPAEHGGDPHDLAQACPNAQARVLAALDEHAPPDYDVGLEATHHGPTDVGAPSMFVEVGSGPEQWSDPEAAGAVARAVLSLPDAAPYRPVETAACADHRPRRHLVGFGGGHYAPRFTRIVRETDWAVGHVAPDWGLDAMGDPETPPGRDTVSHVFEQSRARYALVDGDRPAVAETARSLGYEVVGETWVREASGVPLPLVEVLEDEVAPVADGLRFGEAAADWDGDHRVVDLPAALLEAARGVDTKATRSALADVTVAFCTVDSGTTVTDTAVILGNGDRSAVVAGLVDVLRAGYDAVAWEGENVVARRRAFDPERAAELGVPEGPAFGRLAAGESVAVGDRVIDPDAVHTDVEEEFPV
jgi:D-aminoacyl-tRNA deacylase